MKKEPKEETDNKPEWTDDQYDAALQDRLVPTVTAEEALSMFKLETPGEQENKPKSEKLSFKKFLDKIMENEDQLPEDIKNSLDDIDKMHDLYQEYLEKLKQRGE